VCAVGLSLSGVELPSGGGLQGVCEKRARSEATIERVLVING